MVNIGDTKDQPTQVTGNKNPLGDCLRSWRPNEHDSRKKGRMVVSYEIKIYMGFY